MQAKHSELESGQQQLQDQLQEAQQSAEQLQAEVDRLQPDLQKLQQQLTRQQQAQQEADARVHGLSTALEVSPCAHAALTHEYLLLVLQSMFAMYQPERSLSSSGVSRAFWMLLRSENPCVWWVFYGFGNPVPDICR